MQLRRPRQLPDDQEQLVGATLTGPFVAGRCSVIGAADDCDVRDVFKLERYLSGDAEALDMVCSAYSD